MITIVDYQTGNLGSIANMLKKLGIDSKITSSIDEIVKADKLILPGVGHYDYGVMMLERLGFSEILKEKSLTQHTPILGICLGAQLLLQGSEEGGKPGLGFIAGKCHRFSSSELDGHLRVPHMGWSEIDSLIDIPLLQGLEQDARFYFVHSYYMNCQERSNVAATAEYGKPFHSVVFRDHIVGVQFHPEKSHRYGMKILENFYKNY